MGKSNFTGDRDRQQAIAQALRVIKKQFGTGAIMRMDEQAVTQVDVIPTGSLTLDHALGVGPQHLGSFAVAGHDLGVAPPKVGALRSRGPRVDHRGVERRHR